jgi:hypothetical protein
VERVTEGDAEHVAESDVERAIEREAESATERDAARAAKNGAEPATEGDAARATENDADHATRSSATRVTQSGAERVANSSAARASKSDGEINPKVDDAILDALRIADAESPHDLWERVEDIEPTSGITAGVMIQSLRDKDVEFFEAMFSRLARLDMAAMLVTIYDPGGESFATACKAQNFSQTEFEQLHLLLMATLVGDRYRETQAFQTIRSYYNRLDEAATRAVLAEWRQTPPTAWKT